MISHHRISNLVMYDVIPHYFCSTILHSYILYISLLNMLSAKGGRWKVRSSTPIRRADNNFVSKFWNITFECLVFGGTFSMIWFPEFPITRLSVKFKSGLGSKYFCPFSTQIYLSLTSCLSVTSNTLTRPLTNLTNTSW